MKYAALLALASTVSAHNVDIFNPVNFMKVEHIDSMVKETSHTVKKILKGQEVGGGSKVQWSQCADDKGVFTMDGSTSATPDPLVKGQSVALHLIGALSDDINVKNMVVEAKWNGVLLYHANKPGGSFSDKVDYSLNWDVPSFAPNGAYDVTITGMDTDGKKDLCVEK